MRMSRFLFSSGFELADLVVSSGVTEESWNAVMEVERRTNQSRESFSSDSLRAYVFQHPKNGDCTIVSFATTYSYTEENLQDAKDMVSSSALEPDNFDFLYTREYPSFKLNKAAADLFISNLDGLSKLKTQVVKSKRLIICGRSLGGYVASLFTLMMLESIPSASKDQKLPLCVTFGSPLIGDRNLQKVITENSPWDSCFLHFVSLKDPIPKAFISADTEPNTYKPFGTFFLCSDRRFACFEDPEVILILLGKMGGEVCGNQISDYEEIIRRLESRPICKDAMEMRQSTEWVKNPIQTGLIVQLQGIEALEGQNNININALVENLTRSITIKMERLHLAKKRKESIYEAREKMAELEWYKKTAENGYYDRFKNPVVNSEKRVFTLKQHLNLFWKRIVEEADKKPQVVRTRHLGGGTAYRRMVEPLDIAEYYKDGKTDYLTARRQHEDYKHYYKLEQMPNETKKAEPGCLKEKKACVGSILTEDSCFWAHVEEAMILCRKLKNGEGGTEAKLIEFEKYVMKLIKDYAVNPEIFRGGSTFMKWWKEYESITGNSVNFVNLPLTNFMKKREYEKYEKDGTETLWLFVSHSGM